MKKFFGAVLLILFISCNSSECHLFPLNNEYEWVYKTTYYNADRSIKDTITDSVRIVNTIESDGNTFYDLGMLLPVRNKDCNTIGLLYDRASKNEILLRNNVDADKTELFSQAFSGTPADCYVGVKIIGYKDRFDINGYKCFKTEESFIDCSGKVFKKVVIFISEKIGVVQVSGYEVSSSGQESLQYVQDLTSYNFLVENE